MNTSPLLVKASIRSADIGNLAAEIERLEAAEVDALHFDIMDGRFGPQEVSMGPMFLRGLRKYTEVPFEVHLWMYKPERSLDSYIDAGADCVLFHIEACSDPAKALQKITKAGCDAGLCINPGTDPSTLTRYLDDCKLVNVMTIHPQLSGVVDDEGVTNLKEVSQRAVDRCRDLLVQADGAVSVQTRDLLIEAGAGSLVAGYPIFSSDNYQKAVAEIRGLSINQMNGPS